MMRSPPRPTAQWAGTRTVSPLGAPPSLAGRACWSSKYVETGPAEDTQ